MPVRQQLYLVITFILILAFGMVMGNIILIAMSMVPFFLLLIGRLLEPPGRITVETERIPVKLQLSREFELVRHVTVYDGYGAVRLHQALPKEFKLTKGNNLRMLWKRRKPVRITLTCSIRCSKRGNYEIPPIEWSSRHPLYLTVDNSTIGEPLKISVWPHLLKHRQIRRLKDLALSPFPLADTSKIGVAGTDFREIRSYVSGDPVKTINWKATAHHANPGSIWPLVNEYEKEGRKSVMIFLDASSAVQIGSNIENVLEYSIEAASNLLYYFVDKGYRVGLAVSGDPNRYFYPDSGRQQLSRIIPQLVRVRAGGDPVRLLTAIDMYRHYVLSQKPLSVVVTTMDGKSSDVLERFFDRLKLYYSRRRKSPIALVNVVGRDLIPQPETYESNLSTLMQLQARPVFHRLRKAGVTIIEWNPAKQSFHSILAGRVRR